jgi:hypothetical protein
VQLLNEKERNKKTNWKHAHAVRRPNRNLKNWSENLEDGPTQNRLIPRPLIYDVFFAKIQHENHERACFSEIQQRRYVLKSGWDAQLGCRTWFLRPKNRKVSIPAADDTGLTRHARRGISTSPGGMTALINEPLQIIVSVDYVNNRSSPCLSTLNP